MRAIGRFIGFLIRALVVIVALVVGFAGVTSLGDPDSSPPAPVMVTVSVVLLLAVMVFRRRPGVGGGGGSGGTPATIMRIWQDPRPGAPAIYWTYVLFDVRGERVKVKLSKSQARQFLDHHSPGDVGRMKHRGETLVSWQPASVDQPVSTSHRTAFISYERSWSDDARYVARFLQSRGIEIWIDTDELRAGDRLSRGVEEAIGRADAFVPILSDSYMTSSWCLRELETAQARGIPIFPIKVEAGRLVTPPHLRETLRPILDSTVYVDLRGRDPVVQLEDFAASLAAPHR